MNNSEPDLTKLLDSAMELDAPMYFKLSSNVALFVICLISTSANILILLTISKYQDKKKAIHVYLSNFLICDIIFLISITLEFQLKSYLINEMSSEISCSVLSFGNTIRSVDILFLLMLVFQWFFENTRVTLFEMYSQFFSGTLWIVLVMQIFTLLSTCSVDLILNYGDNSLGVTMVLFDLFLCIFMILRKCTNPFSKTFGSITIAIANAVPIFWIIPLVTGFLAVALRLHSHFARSIIQVIDMLIFLYPLITFWMFYRMDKKFKTGLRIVFGKDVSRDDRLDFCEDKQDIKMEPAA